MKGDGLIAAPKEKEKFTMWLYPETLSKIKELYREDNCRSKSEFIEKAVRFYIGYLTAEDKSNFLPNMFMSNMKSIIAESENKESRLLFKLAVEMAMMMNIIASMEEIDEITLQRLRASCVKEVKSLNGGFSFEDAVKWQRHDEGS